MCFSSISGQRMIPLTRAALDSLMNPKLLDGGKEILEFKQMEQSVGSLQESDSSVSVVYDFICKKETSITRIQTFCGCTVADYQKSPLKIGESGKIIVKDIDVNGVENLINLLKQDTKVITIFLRVPKEILMKRLENRVDKPSLKEITLRLNRFDYEESRINLYDYVLKNDNLEKTVQIISTIINNEYAMLNKS